MEYINVLKPKLSKVMPKRLFLDVYLNEDNYVNYCQFENEIIEFDISNKLDAILETPY